MDPTLSNNNVFQPTVQAAPTGGGGGGIDWGNIGNILGGLGGAYGAYSTANNSQGLINAGNAGFGMAGNAYNPTLFGMNGVGGSGFSLSSPNGGPGSVSSSLGAFNPMYGQYAGAANNYLGQSQNLANMAAGGATGAYNSALSSIMPQLQNMQGNLLAANNNSLFQRGQLGSGSFGQYGSNGNPTNLTTQSLGSGFALQDLNAITAAQNQGLNFFNSNLQGANALGGLGYGATNSGLGMLGAQNTLGQLPLAYSQLYGGQQLGATNANANTIGAVAGRNGINLGGGYGGLASGIGGGLANGAGGILGQLGQATGATGPNGWLSNLFGGGNPGSVGGDNPGSVGGGMVGSYNPGNSIFGGGPGSTSVDYGGVGNGIMPTSGGVPDTSFLSNMGDIGGGGAAAAAAYAAMPAADAGLGAGIGAGVDTSMQLAPLTGYGTGGISGANAAVGGADAASTGSGGAAGLGSFALPLAALGATYWAGGRGTNVNTSGLMSALQAGPNGNPGYAGDLLEASSLAGNWGGAQGGYGGLNVDSSGLSQWLAQNGYSTQLGNVNPNTPWSSNPYKSLIT